MTNTYGTKHFFKEAEKITQRFENIFNNIANNIEDFLSTSRSNVKVDMWRNLTAACSEFETESKAAMHNVQACMRQTHAHAVGHKDSVATKLYQGFENLVKANAHMGTVIIKNIQLLQHYASNEPKPKHEKELKDTLKHHLTEAKKSFKEGVKLIKEALHDGLKLLSGAPSKIAHLFGFKAKTSHEQAPKAKAAPKHKPKTHTRD